MEDEAGKGEERLAACEAELAKLSLEEISRESDLLSQDPVWTMPYALALIAFHDRRRIADSSWSWLRSIPPAPVEGNPQRVLYNWLLEGQITASLDGEEKPKRFWDSVEYYDLLKKYHRARFRRDDLEKRVFEDLQERAEVGPPVDASSARTVPRKNGRKPKIDWEMAENEMNRLMEHHGEFSPHDSIWNCQACLERAVKEYIDRTFGEDAIKSESVIRDRVAHFLRNRRAEN